MGNLIQLLKKFYLYLLFILLEIISISLYSSSNSYTQASLFELTNNWVGQFFQTKTNLLEYLDLKEINSELVQENTLLKNQIAKTDSPSKLPDSIIFRPSFVASYDTLYHYIPARIVECPVYGSNNLITLNQGSLNGITRDMGVINSDGVLGIVIKTSPNFSLVRPIINSHGPTGTGISGMLKNNRALGSVQWQNESDYRKAQLVNIERANSVSIGDTVITTGMSPNFPEGIMIGTVTSAQCAEGSEFYTITIALAVDYKKASFVQVITNPLNTEKQQLEAAEK